MTPVAQLLFRMKFESDASDAIDELNQSSKGSLIKVLSKYVKIDPKKLDKIPDLVKKLSPAAQKSLRDELLDLDLGVLFTTIDDREFDSEDAE